MLSKPLKPYDDPFEYFESKEFLKRYDEETEKQVQYLQSVKIDVIERANRTQMVQDLHKQGKYDEMWKIIEETVRTYNYSIDFEVAPTKDVVSLIVSEIKKLDLKGIVSIGCSNGLLEFFLQLEADRNKYDINVYAIDLFKGPTAFQGLTPQIHRSPYYYDYCKVIEMDYRDTYVIKSNQALLMCYSHPADKLWQKYFKVYKGNCIVVIGKKYITLPYPQIFKEFPNMSKDKWVEEVHVPVGSRNYGTSMSIFRKVAGI